MAGNPIATANGLADLVDVLADVPRVAQNPDNIYIPDWGNRPPERKAVLSLAGVPVLTQGNMTALIAAQGNGKTSICEAIATATIAPNADCLGFSATANGCILIDFERTDTDVWNSFARISRRAGLTQGAPMPGLTVAGMRHIPRLKQRIAAIAALLDSHPCELLIMDGAGDLVLDTNELNEAIECRIYLRELTVKYGVSIFTTLHPNPGGFKPRGHIGSEIIREAEAVLISKKWEGESRMITTDFEHGKNRNAGQTSAAFRWSDQQMMFVQDSLEDLKAAAESAKRVQKLGAATNLGEAIFLPGVALSYKEAICTIQAHLAVSEDTAKRRLKELKMFNLINIGDDKKYRKA